MKITNIIVALVITSTAYCSSGNPTPTPTPASTPIPAYFTAGTNNGQVDIIDSTNAVSWSLTVTNNYDLEGGIFSMLKDTNDTEASITFEVFYGNVKEPDILNNKANPFASITLTEAQFDAQVPTDGIYGTHTFTFTNAVSLTNGITYTFALESSATNDCANDTAYYIEDNGVSDAKLQAVPEPSTCAMLGLGVVTLAVIYRRRQYSI
jgi:hypothetical protein